LEHKTYVSKSSNTFLDELLAKNTEDGSVVDKTATSDSSTASSTVSELTAGAVIDESV
jgi:hypothetical protein